jgi:hypothetical protein
LSLFGPFLLFSMFFSSWFPVLLFTMHYSFLGLKLLLIAFFSSSFFLILYSTHHIFLLFLSLHGPSMLFIMFLFSS